MKNFIQLVNFEMNRFFKMYAALFILTILVQLVGTTISAMSYMRRVNQLIHTGATQKEVLEQLSSFGLIDIIYRSYFMFPILVGITALLFYTFFIWYRDWFAKNSFIYRLLTLPTSRINVYYAKLTTIMLTTLGLAGLQLILLAVEKKIIQLIVPKVYRSDYTVSQTIMYSEELQAMLPIDFSSFIVYYFIGLIFTTVIFTAILLERSYKLIGAILGAIYTVLAAAIVILPFFIQYAVIGKPYLYPVELFLLTLLIAILILIVSLWLSNYLMNKKITV